MVASTVQKEEIEQNYVPTIDLFYLHNSLLFTIIIYIVGVRGEIWEREGITGILITAIIS